MYPFFNSLLVEENYHDADDFGVKRKIAYRDADEIITKISNDVEYRKIADKFRIKRVIFNAPATIVLWKDGTKTVVKASGENFDKEKGLAMAITKRILGNNKGNYNDIFKKWCKEDNND